MNIEEFWNTETLVAIHCNTLAKAKRLLKIFAKMGKKWQRDIPYTQSGWSYYREYTCYDNKNSFGQLSIYKIANAQIIEFDDLDEFKPMADYEGGKPNTLSPRAWKTYNLIKSNSSKGEWTSKKAIIAANPFNPQTNQEGYIKNDRKHDLCAGIWEDVESVNMCPVIEKIIISDNKNNFKLASSREEALEYANSKYKNKLIKAAIRYYAIISKIKKDGQGKLLSNTNKPIDLESKARDFIESFEKEVK